MINNSSIHSIPFDESIGERLDEKEVDDIMAACCDAEDDDGMIPYKRKFSNSFDRMIIFIFHLIQYHFYTHNVVSYLH